MPGQSRLDYLEGRVEEQSKNWERVFADIGRLDRKIDALGISLSNHIHANSDRVFAEIGRLDQKMDAVGIGLSARINAVYTAFDQQIDRKVNGLRTEQTTQFHWTIGIMTALISGVLAAVLSQ